MKRQRPKTRSGPDRPPGRRREGPDMSVSRLDFGDRERHTADVLIAQALAEDLGELGDITSKATVPSHARATASVRGPIAGRAGRSARRRATWSAEFEMASSWQPHLADGDLLEPGTVIARVAGPVRSLLALERTALNFLQRLSGIATFDRAVRRQRRAHPREDLRHAQNHPRLARPRKVRRPLRRGVQPSFRALRCRTDQGQPSRLAARARGAAGAR